MIVRHTSWFDFSETPRRKLLANPEFFFRLTVYHRRAAFLYRDVIGAFQRRGEFLWLGNILTVCAKRFCDLVVSKILLEEMYRQCPAVSAVAGLRSPGVAV